jgi:hypothetical protein
MSYACDDLPTLAMSIIVCENEPCFCAKRLTTTVSEVDETNGASTATNAWISVYRRVPYVAMHSKPEHTDGVVFT